MENNILCHYCRELQETLKPSPVILLMQIPQSPLESISSAIAISKGYYAYPPAGLLYLTSALENSLFSVHILDLNLEMLRLAHTEENTVKITQQLIDVVDDKIKEYSPGFIGISCMFDLGLPFAKTLLRHIKESTAAITIAGGVSASYNHSDLLTEYCHFVIRGEGENRLKYLLQQFKFNTNQRIEATNGIFFKQNGQITESCGSSSSPDFDYNLSKSYEKINLHDYALFGSLNPFSRIRCKNNPFSTIQLNRGCRGKCRFCSVRSFMGSGVRTRSIEKLMEELLWLYHKQGVRHLEWLDDDLLHNRPRFAGFLHQLAEMKLDLTWSANNGVIASCLNDEILDLMTKSGCIGFKIGFESGDENILRQVGKPGTISAFRRAAKAVNRHPDMFAGGNFMLGFPEEDFSRLLSTFKFFLELNLDWGAFTICQSISGAPAFADFATPAANFIPSRSNSKGRIETEKNTMKNMDVFQIKHDIIPSSEQLKEIWFTFNLLGNYIMNKNLSESGRPEKFSNWVEAAVISYPENPYMHLFLSVAKVLTDHKEEATMFHKKALKLSDNDYWMRRLQAFGLEPLLEKVPENQERAYFILHKIRAENEKKLQ